MTDQRDRPFKEREVLELLLTSFTEENTLEWFTEEQGLEATRWDFLVIMEALVMALKQGKMGDVMADHVKRLGKSIGGHFIEDGFVPIDEIRDEWRECLGLFK